jgi:hypothetical protein
MVAKDVTSAIPIVFLTGFDPVKSGLVASISLWQAASEATSNSSGFQREGSPQRFYPRYNIYPSHGTAFAS